MLYHEMRGTATEYLLRFRAGLPHSTPNQKLTQLGNI